MDSSNAKNGQEFRVNRKIFYIGLINSIVFSLILIGIPMLIYIIIWYKTTSVVIKEDGMDYRTGWLVVKKKHIPYNRINSVDITVDIFGKWLGYGNLEISTGNDSKGLVINGIDKAESLKEAIELSIKKSKASAS